MSSEASDFDSSIGCQSQPLGNSSQASSHIALPRWRRLLRAAAKTIAKYIEEGKEDRCNGPLLDCLQHQDASGGGSFMDVFQTLKFLLEALDLPEVDTGAILIGMYHFVQAPDVPITSDTWRTATVTALRAAVIMIVKDPPKAEEAIIRLEGCIAHWWPADKANKAYQVFVEREAFRNWQPTPANQADAYFTLRQKGLCMSEPDDASQASAVMSFQMDNASEKNNGSVRGSRQMPRGNIGMSASSGASLMISEDSEMTGSDGQISFNRDVISL